MYKKLKVLIAIFALGLLFVPFRALAISEGCITTVGECGEDTPPPSQDDNGGGGSNLLLRYIRVTSPNEGEVWGIKTSSIQSTDNTYPITWESYTHGILYVNIYYTTDGGQNYNEVVTNYPNTGYYPWVLPQIDADNVYIRINAFGENNHNFGSDSSNSPFVILNNPTF